MEVDVICSMLGCIACIIYNCCCVFIYFRGYHFFADFSLNFRWYLILWCGKVCIHSFKTFVFFLTLKFVMPLFPRNPQKLVSNKYAWNPSIPCPVPSQEYISRYQIYRFCICFCCNSVFLLFWCFHLSVDVVWSVSRIFITSPNRFLNFQMRYTHVALI